MRRIIIELDPRDDEDPSDLIEQVKAKLSGKSAYIHEEQDQAIVSDLEKRSKRDSKLEEEVLVQVGTALDKKDSNLQLLGEENKDQSIKDKESPIKDFWETTWKEGLKVVVSTGVKYVIDNWHKLFF